MLITTLISTLRSTLQQEKSGPPIKERSSEYLRPETYFVTLLTSLPFSLSSRPFTTTTPSLPHPPSSSDSQQEPAPLSKPVRKPCESNHPRTSLWATSSSLSSEASEKPSRPFPPSAAKPIGATWSC